MAIYNICGQPHSGKTTIAIHLKNILKSNNNLKPVVILDGDEVRKFFLNFDYSKEGRFNNIQRIYSIAGNLSTKKNMDVIIAAVSPFREQRNKFKNDFNVIEIYVHTSNIRGREKYHTNFEMPVSDYIDVDTTDVDELTTMNELLNKIDEFGTK